jgi:hypothetical protein
MSATNYTTDTYLFGAGYIYGLNVGGAQPSLIVPGSFATVQEATVDIATTLKELRGTTEDAELVASAARKITGKVTTGRINIEQLNQFVFGETLATGSTQTANFEPHTLTISPAVDTVTITPPGSGVFAADLGVWYAGTRNQLVPIPYTASPVVNPAQGEYSCDELTGEYFFNSADEGAGLLFSYRYTVTTGHNLLVTNKVMGVNTRPVFALYLTNPDDGDHELVLFACKASKVAMPIKSEDFCKLELDFTAFQNGSGQTLQFISST